MRPSPRCASSERVLDETTPDALIAVGLDHPEAFSPDVSPAFALVGRTGGVGSFGSKQYPRGVHQPLARALLDGVASSVTATIAFCPPGFHGPRLRRAPLNTFSRSDRFLSCRSSLMSACRRCHSPIEPIRLGRRHCGGHRRTRRADSDPRQWECVPMLPRDEVR